MLLRLLLCGQVPFLVGLIAASSDVFRKLESLVFPLKVMFAAVFFVSIGLQVDPMALWHYLPHILVVSFVVVFGKMFNVAVASLAAGLDIKASVQNAFALAQIGEFAFLVAIIYAGLSGKDDLPMFEVTIGASLLTTLVNPLMVRASEKAGDLAVKMTPDRFRRMLSTYQTWLEKIRSSDDSPALLLLRAAAIKLGVYAVLMLSVSVICSLLYKYDYSRFSGFFERHDAAIFFFLANFFSVALMPMVYSASQALADEIAELLTGEGGSAKWRLHVRQLIRFVVLAAVMALFFVEWTMINVSILSVGIKLQGVSTVIVLGVGIVGWRFFVKMGRRATQRFQEAISAEERREGLVRMTTISVPEGVVQKLRLDADSPAVGETVVSLDIRAKTGASVVSVVRDGQITRNIGPEWEFRIGDILVALGDQPQIAALKDLLGVTS